MTNKNRIYEAVDNKMLLRDFKNQQILNDAVPKEKFYILNKMISCDSDNDISINFNDIMNLLIDSQNSYVIILDRDVSCIEVLVDILDNRLQRKAKGVLLNIRMSPSLDISILSNIIDIVNQNIDNNTTLIFSTCEDIKIYENWIQLMGIVTY